MALIPSVHLLLPRWLLRTQIIEAAVPPTHSLAPDQPRQPTALNLCRLLQPLPMHLCSTNHYRLLHRRTGMAMQKERSVGSSLGAASMLFVYVASALLPGAGASLPIMMSSLPIMSSLENCKKMTLDFVIRDNKVQMAAVDR